MDWQDKLMWSAFFITGNGIGGFLIDTAHGINATVMATVVVLAILSFDWLKSRGKHSG